MSRAGYIYLYMHVACMFHVTGMDLGRIPWMQHFSIENCFPKVLKLDTVLFKLLAPCAHARTSVFGTRDLSQPMKSSLLC